VLGIDTFTPLWDAAAPLVVAGRVAVVLAQGSAFPFLLVLLVILFLLVQHEIDRRDPKLALAPVHPDRDRGFVPAVTGAH
jgi:hypothetical protein